MLVEPTASNAHRELECVDISLIRFQASNVYEELKGRVSTGPAFYYSLITKNSGVLGSAVFILHPDPETMDYIL